MRVVLKSMNMMSGFENNPDFALAARIMREKVLRVSQAELADKGGPNTTYLSQIETGKPRTITPEIIENYRTAIKCYTEPDFPPHQDLASPSTAAVSFFDALATACLPDSVFDEPEFGAVYSYAGEEPEPDTGMFIGDDLITGRPIYASELLAIDSDDPDHPDSPRTNNWPPDYEPEIVSSAIKFATELCAERRKEEQFRQSVHELTVQDYRNAHVALAAAQHDAITVVSTIDGTGAAASACWRELAPPPERDMYDVQVDPLSGSTSPLPRQVYALNELQLDPLAGITSLQDAEARARIIGGNDAADGAIVALAWIILLSNALAEWLEEPGPLAAWRRYHQYSERWNKLYRQLDDKVQADLPPVENLLADASTYLRPWAGAYGTPLWNVIFTPKAKEDKEIRFSPEPPNIAFSATELPRQPAPTLNLGDLIRYTGQPYLRVATTLAAMGHNVIELTDTSIRKISPIGTSNPDIAAAPAYQWCPTPHPSHILLRKVGSDTWRAARPTAALQTGQDQ